MTNRDKELAIRARTARDVVGYHDAFATTRRSWGGAIVTVRPPNTAFCKSARYLVMWLVRGADEYSLPEVAAAVGVPSHTTVLTACRKCGEYPGPVANDERLARLVGRFEDGVKGAPVEALPTRDVIGVYEMLVMFNRLHLGDGECKEGAPARASGSRARRAG